MYINPFLVLEINLNMKLIQLYAFALPSFLLSEHHQEGDWSEVCVQVCVVPRHPEDGPPGRGDGAGWGRGPAPGGGVSGAGRRGRGRVQTAAVGPSQRGPAATTDIHSGLYSSFTVSSLRNQQHLLRAIKVEKERTEREEEARTVIRFVANRSEKSGAPPVVPSPPHRPPRPRATIFFTSKPSPSRRPSASCSSSPSPSRSPIFDPGRGRSLEETRTTRSSARSAEPVAGHRDRVSNQLEKRSSGGAGGNPAKTKKPKGLEISAPSLLLSASDIGSIALNSPALPSGSLTPAFFTAQVSLTFLSFYSLSPFTPQEPVPELRN